MVLHPAEAAPLQPGPVQNEVCFGSLFEEAPVPYHELDREGVVQRVNQAECELLGRDRAQLAGHPIWDFVAHRGARGLPALYRQENGGRAETGPVPGKVSARRRQPVDG